MGPFLINIAGNAFGCDLIEFESFGWFDDVQPFQAGVDGLELPATEHQDAAKDGNHSDTANEHELDSLQFVKRSFPRSRA